ncbi:Tim44 domain-containing protein [Clostridium chromiireducens]|uniref:Tim44 domain-containing protein n=1 Tax=Clostridium chromiireducens TaxID=225345 RepID=A0A399ILD9_9CLOT|nr:Tim44-like domain-containing protein [Clostridium chromiireducens]RII33109.1 Tim44 domain-containing protein [Clostridium chromiireducens]
MWEIFDKPNKKNKYINKAIDTLSNSEELYYTYMTIDKNREYDREDINDLFFYKIKRAIAIILCVVILNKLGLPDIVKWYYNGGIFPIKATFLVSLSLVLVIIHIFKIDDYYINKLLYNNEINKKKKETNEFINTIKKDSRNIAYAFLRSTVKETFFKVNESLEQMNFEMCEKYISSEFYNIQQAQCKRYFFNNIIRVIDELELIEADPIGIIHHHDSYEDVVWFLIKYRAKDYVVDETDGEILFGSNKVKTFIQYWKFQKEGENTWLLSDVIIKGERDIKKFKIVNEF